MSRVMSLAYAAIGDDVGADCFVFALVVLVSLCMVLASVAFAYAVHCLLLAWSATALLHSTSHTVYRVKSCNYTGQR
eukprot:6953251-Alexandrium_andersonii.AAC.1